MCWRCDGISAASDVVCGATTRVRQRERALAYSGDDVRGDNLHPAWICTTVVKKGSSPTGRHNARYNPMSERPEIPAARLSGRRPRAARRSPRRANRLSRARPAGARRISQDGPKNINMPGFREVVRCSQCGNPVSSDVGLDTRCPRCGTDLHACSQCVSFDPGSRFECMDPALTARVSPKNARNACTLFSPAHDRRA